MTENSGADVAPSEVTENEDDDEISVDGSSIGSTAEIKAELPPTAGIAGTGILSPLAAAKPPKAPGAPPAGYDAGSGETKRGRGRSSGEIFISRFVNMDFEPGVPGSPWNFSSAVTPYHLGGGPEPQAGLKFDKSYYDAYKTELQVVNDTKSKFGIKWQGNGNIGYWTSPLLGPDGKPVLDAEGAPMFRRVECVNPPQRVLDFQATQANFQAESQARAVRNAELGIGTLPAGNKGAGTAKSQPKPGQPHSSQDVELLVTGTPDGEDLDLDLTGALGDSAPRKASGNVAPAQTTAKTAQPKAIRGAQAQAAATTSTPIKPVAASMSIEDALRMAGAQMAASNPVPTMAPPTPAVTTPPVPESVGFGLPPGIPGVTSAVTVLPEIVKEKLEPPISEEAPSEEPTLETDLASAEESDVDDGTTTLESMPFEEEEPEKPSSLSEMTNPTDDDGEPATPRSQTRKSKRNG